MFDIIGKRFWFLLISGVIVLISIISLVTFGLNLGVEFSSGSIMTVSFEQELEQDQSMDVKETIQQKKDLILSSFIQAHFESVSDRDG